MSKSKMNIAQRIWARVIKQKDVVDDEGQVLAEFDDRGLVKLDNTPMAIPAGLSIPESLDMKLARLFREDHFRRSLAAEDLETFEESQDFGFLDDDDDIPDTPYQRHAALAAVQAADRGLTSPFDVSAGIAARERINAAKAAKKAGEKPANKPASKEADKIPSE